MTTKNLTIFPAALELTHGWELLSGARGAKAYTLLAGGRFRVRDTGFIGLHFDDSWMTLSVANGSIDLGRLQYRMARDGGAWGPWYTVPIAKTTHLVSSSPSIIYDIEFRIIVPAMYLRLLDGDQLEQYRTGSGATEGTAHVLSGIEVSPGASFLPVTLPSTPLRVALFGSGAMTACAPDQANVTGLVQALERIVATTTDFDGLSLFPCLYESLVGGDYDYPFNGHANYAALRAAEPATPPQFADIFDVPYEGGAAITNGAFPADIVIYAVGDRDAGTDLPDNDASAYEADIVANLDAIRTLWPTAYILIVLPTANAAVRSGIAAAAVTFADANTDVVDLQDVLTDHHENPNATCFTARVHQVMGYALAQYIITSQGFTPAPCPWLAIDGDDLTINSGSLLCLSE